MSRGPIKTSAKKVVDFWLDVLPPGVISPLKEDAAKCCWRCNYRSRLQRCHIVPHSLGGKDEANNFVLLCKRCHEEAPNHRDPSYMWCWIQAHSLTMQDMYWTKRGMEEFSKMFGQHPYSRLAGINLPQKAAERVGSLLRGAMDDASFHFGQGRLNPATIAAILSECERQLVEDFGTPEQIRMFEEQRFGPTMPWALISRPRVARSEGNVSDG